MNLPEKLDLLISESKAAAVWLPADKLKPWDENPRPEDNTASEKRVAESLRRFGFAAPTLARKECGMIIAGHTRYAAAVAHLGFKEVPVRLMDLSLDAARLLALADNRLQALGLAAQGGLMRVLSSLEEDGLDLSAAGYGEDDLNKILGRMEPADVSDPGAEPVPESPDSQPGEVYQLGPHRLLCGDSTDVGAVATALDGQEADLVWTDPPYGVNLGTEGSEAYGSKRRQDGKVVQNDDLSGEDLHVLLEAALGAALENTRKGGAWYVAGPNNGPMGFAFVSVLNSLGVYRPQLVWVKDRIVLGRADYHYQHEPIFYGWKEGAGRHPVEDRSASTVFKVDRPGHSSEHPTMKPVELIEPMIVNSSNRDDLVLDPFGGSGSTLIAAARTGRRAALVELDPGYCDVIRRRWTAYAEQAGIDPGPGALR